MAPGRPQPGRLEVRYNHEAMNPGTRLGPYEIISLLGAGGMGEVYTGRDSRGQREVANKAVPGSLRQDARAGTFRARDTSGGRAQPHQYPCHLRHRRP